MMKFGQEFKQTQQLTMTPQLQQAIKLLQLSQLELSDLLLEELETNPALEEIVDFEEEKNTESDLDKKNDDILEVEFTDTISEEMDWDAFLQEDPTGRVTSEYEAKDAPFYERFVAPETTLLDHLRFQLFPIDLPEHIREAALLLIENINPDGYLEAELDTLETPEITLADLKEALYILQTFDPAGVAARNVSECLVLQLYRKGFVDSDVSVRIVNKYLPFLEQRNLNAIRKVLNVKMSAVEKAVEEILLLSPRPGSSFGADEGTYITPDVFIQKIEDDFVVTLNTDGLPRLCISPYCKKALLDSHISSAEKKYIKEKYQSAAWLLKSIYQRQRTIYKVTSQIAQNQIEFLEKGIEYLKSMTLKDVANEINMHESTVSRVTTNKYVHTPQGIFELKYFFKSGIKKHGADAVASVSVQNQMKQLISAELADKPYSDEELASLLQDQGLNIARRTVAKYREAMGIPSSSKRKPLKRGSRI